MKIMEKLDGDIDLRKITKNHTAYLQLDTITEDQRLFAALVKVNFFEEKNFLLWNGNKIFWVGKFRVGSVGWRQTNIFLSPA